MPTVFLRASLHGLRERPRRGLGVALFAALWAVILTSLWPNAGAAGVGLAAIVAAGIGLFVPSAIHEASGRWQLRPKCWEKDGEWFLEINTRWPERFSCTCTVSDGFRRSAVHEFGQLGGRAALRFPTNFEHAEGMNAGSDQPRGPYVVRWIVRQAGNTFEASSEFVWRAGRESNPQPSDP
jgi:hypothetical protein